MGAVRAWRALIALQCTLPVASRTGIGYLLVGTHGYWKIFWVLTRGYPRVLVPTSTGYWRH
jgi:hypothetical protein